MTSNSANKNETRLCHCDDFEPSPIDSPDLSEKEEIETLEFFDGIFGPSGSDSRFSFTVGSNTLPMIEMLEAPPAIQRQTRTASAFSQTHVVSPSQSPLAASQKCIIPNTIGLPFMPELTLTTETIRPKKKQHNKRNKVPTGPLDFIEGEPAENDVRFGRGDCNNNHPGNKQLFALVREYQTEYKNATSVEAKRAVVRKVLAYIQRVNGRFVKQEAKGSRWYVVPFEDRLVYNKVSQSLRDNHESEARRKKRLDHLQRVRNQKLEAETHQ